MRFLIATSSFLLMASMPVLDSRAEAQDATAGSYSLTLKIEGVRSSHGQIRAELLSRLAGDTQPKSITAKAQQATAGQTVVVFRGLTAGDYAVQLYHDENGNGRVEMNIVGMPTEGYAFSNIPIVQGGIPPFDKMKVVVDADVEATAVMAYAP